MGGRGGNTVGHTTCLHVWPMVSLLSLQLMTFKITLNLRFLKYLPYRMAIIQCLGINDKS